MSEKNIVEKAVEAGIVKVELSLYKPFVNFLKDYLEFFGDNKTVEDLCRKMVYSEICRLYRELDEFSQKESSFVSKSALFNKHAHISIVAFEDQNESN